ncbi:MAG: 2-C-methyl-D-erythritol 4-phosphate cytidylyltransferase [Deltaproteobacteria bacterium]|nr:2-C-methyl-D-erythritol 4-phosphate cytidylyltransferase [Deltaproteobacteria bacterium]
MKAAVIIVAAGQGVRMGAEIPKAFVPLGGMPILAHTLRTLSRVPAATELIVVVAEASLPRLQQLLDRDGPWRLPIQIAIGGAQRQDSVAAGLALVSADTELVAVHDAARPFVSPDCVSAAIEAAAAHGAALLALPSQDTVKLVDDRGVVTATPPRSTVWLAQTPQVFRTALLRQAHARARSYGLSATDDAALVEQLGVPVRVVPGNPANVKLTTPDDLHWAEWYLREHPTLR